VVDVQNSFTKTTTVSNGVATENVSFVGAGVKLLVRADGQTRIAASRLKVKPEV
jgi:hypothetical protein